jgi:hypothetical protein
MAQALNHVQTVTGGLDKVHFMNGGKHHILTTQPYHTDFHP